MPSAPLWARRGLLAAAFGAVALVGVGGCGGGGSSSGGSAASPTVTVLVKNTDCPIKDISITNFKVEQDSSGGALHLNINATVLCKGNPQKGVTLTFTIPGASAATTAESDENGNASTNVLTPHNADLVGQDVGVAVTGGDGKSYPQGQVQVTKAP